MFVIPRFLDIFSLPRESCCMFKDVETTKSKVTIWVKNKMYEYLDDTSTREVKGHVRIVGYERGKKVLERDGHNIWTVEGRKYSAMMKAYQSYAPLTPARQDRIRYIGIGSGTQPEVGTVSRLVTPVPYNVGNDFLATLDLPTYSIDGTEITFSRSFAVNEISVVGTVSVSEVGLFTDGIAPTYAPGTRPVSFAAATNQVPMGYKTFEPFPKTTDITLQVQYTLIHN